jgi:integrase
MFGMYIRVMVATGARRAEVWGLRWSDVDFDAGTLNVSRSYTVLPGVRADRPTKTRSVRTVVLDPATIEELEAGWTIAREIADISRLDVERRRTGYIFAADPMGERAWRPDTANRWWAQTRTAIGVAATVRLHDLRHFQATQLLDAGVPVPPVAARLGHADDTTTMKIYAHRTRRADEHAAEVVGNLLSPMTTIAPDGPVRRISPPDPPGAVTSA